jgi:hypothetical protein
MLHPALGRQVSATARQALVACARAANETDPISRITALWEAIEFYVSDTSVPDMFSKEELKRVKKALPKDLEQDKRQRMMNVFGALNNPPLFTRLRRRLAVDAVSITQDELDLLRRLRDVRNDVAHGRPVDPPTIDDITHGVGIVARMLVHSVHNDPSS